MHCTKCRTLGIVSGHIWSGGLCHLLTMATPIERRLNTGKKLTVANMCAREKAQHVKYGYFARSATVVIPMFCTTNVIPLQWYFSATVVKPPATYSACHRFCRCLFIPIHN